MQPALTLTEVRPRLLVRSLKLCWFVAVNLCVAQELFALEVRQQQPVNHQIEALQQQAIALEIAQRPVWRQLLRYYGNERVSRALSDRFFLDSQGSTDPARELLATLAAFYAPVGEESNLHPQCVFPARFYWLDKQLDFARFNLVKVDCQQLEAWARLDEMDSVSMVLASGDYSNPASSFGHGLLKLNNGGENSRNSLLDSALNYAADIPDSENRIAYFLRGMFGGYQARFRNHPFYQRDLVYSHIESRDMWEYKLNLTAYEKRMVAYQLWELANVKFDYYFLRQNCATAPASILATAMGHRFISTRRPWYPSVMVFHVLEDLNAARGGTLIRDIRFWPSNKRALYNRFEDLSVRQRQVANQQIRSADSVITLPEGLTADERVGIAEFMLDYYRYQLYKADKPDKSALEQRRQEWLSYRLGLPPVETVGDIPQGAKASAAARVLPPPAKGTKPIRLGVALVHEKAVTGNSEQSLELAYSAFQYDLLGDHAETGAIFRSLDGAIRVNESGDVRLQYFNFIKVQDLNLYPALPTGESHWSWRAQAGFKQRAIGCEHCLMFQLRGGLGQARRLGDRGAAYLMVDALGQTGGEAWGISPALGMVFNHGQRWKSALEGGYQSHPGGHGESRPLLSLQTRYRIAQDSELRLQYRKDEGQEWHLSWNFYW